MDLLGQFLPRNKACTKGLLTMGSGAPHQKITLKSSQSAADNRRRKKYLRKVHKYLQSDSRDPYTHFSATGKLWETDKEKRDPIISSKEKNADNEIDLEDMTCSTSTLDNSSSSLSIWCNEDNDNDNQSDSSSSSLHAPISAISSEEEEIYLEESPHVHVPTMTPPTHDSLEMLVDVDDYILQMVNEEISSLTPEAVTPPQPQPPLQQRRANSNFQPRLNLARRETWRLLVLHPDYKTLMKDWKQQRQQLVEHRNAIKSQRETLRTLRSTSKTLNRPLRRGFVALEDADTTNLMFSIIREVEEQWWSCDEPHEEEDKQEDDAIADMDCRYAEC